MGSDFAPSASRRKRRWTLAQLISGITEANRHSEISWAPPVGEEVW